MERTAQLDDSGRMERSISSSPAEEVILREIPIIHKIIQDETWLEGERRGCYVPDYDAVVQENVCDIVLRVGHLLRASAETVTSR